MSSILKNRERNIRLLIFIFFITLVYLKKKTFFIEGDGFYSQIKSVLNGVEHKLRGVHTIRFLIIYPFFLAKNNSIIQFLIMYLYGKPIIKNKNIYTYSLILAIFFLFNYRTSIVSLSLPYFYLYLKNNKKRYLFLSGIFSILSSATIINFILIYILHNFNKLYKKIFFLIPVIFLFVPSFFHKIQFFTAGGKGYFMTMFYRSFLIEAVILKNYSRILISVFIFLNFLLEILKSFKSKKINTKLFEGNLAIIFLFMEGLGAYSYLIQIIINFFEGKKNEKRKSNMGCFSLDNRI